MSDNHTPISVTELNQAEFYLIKYEQCVHFDPEIACVKRRKFLPLRSPIQKLDLVLVSGILRIAGRLAKSVLPFDLKHSIVLPETSHLTYVIIQNTHVNLVGHSGVYATLNCLCQRFWIVNARVTVRRVVSNCVTCRKTNSNLEHQYMANLPVARFQIHQPPFSHVGVDFFGPLLVKVKRSEVKRYGCLFTCMTTRAIHLELAQDMSSSSFINVLRRFVARPSPNFVGTNKLLKNCFSDVEDRAINNYSRQNGIVWSFNPPQASHMGGVWERMIRTVRKVLLAVMPSKTSTDDDLLMILSEVESIVNSHPLTDVPLENGEETPLTPNHLLRLNSSVVPPGIAVKDKDCYSRQRYRIVQYVADKFWKRWIVEYPRSILNRTKWKKKRRNLSLGDIVLLQDVTYPRGQWSLAKIIKVFPDEAGLVRTVIVQTSKGKFKRPITKLCLILPAAQGCDQT